ncbi:ABC transporter permease [Methanosarcina sp. 2.H.T.1A.6]|uniref:ABC transporter permease n=1 Tax=unclassified Methanosarcina TaxID=2644672 RepID=UPI0006221BF8|nr:MULTISPECIES: ABC transporter permease [unclassified Methanosarcina]KKG17032.1 ABC transporter permease [Methanosarcina sp. 2.H.T.1A.3]KKG20344.1 ABC transporter permease [Methanosarcina sp. 2.H.T.1A.6]KKG23391.1 ABC transporter permease [Methanosarcina sp. 2.H.T.1A.8]KKG27683.1 ABC transporter permease [Methanosarcina sp. 2.H.T.1A.15]
MVKDRNSFILRLLSTLFVILAINFFLPRMMPGDPFSTTSADEVGEEIIVMTEEQRLYYLNYYGLDRPLHEQFLGYMKNLMKGDLGRSIYYKMPVRDVIMLHLPWTVLIVVGATIISTISGVVLGTLSAKNRKKGSDRLMMMGMISFAEIPSFLLGLILLLVFSVHLRLFPLAGAVTPFADYNGPAEQAWDILYHASLPIVTLSLSQLTGVYLLTRNTLITVTTKDYIRTARAKGLGENTVWIRHALRNALLPVVTRTGFMIGIMMGGVVLVESVFSYPGIGMTLRSAVVGRDYPLIQGILLVIAVSILICNLLVDKIYGKLDPRVVI